MNNELINNILLKIFIVNFIIFNLLYSRIPILF